MREHAIRVGTAPSGRLNAITDVPGVSVGHATLIEGEGEKRVGTGPVRTGVTVVVPHSEIWREPVLAGVERINGNGDITGLEWLRESGQLMTPIALTNTHSLGVVRDALVRAHIAANPAIRFSLPVVGETYDGYLNDVNGQHVRAEHLDLALADASAGPVLEGAVGSGTGMVCHGFKGGIGSASRIVELDAERWTVGVLVQANHGVRERLTIDGVAVGQAIGADRVPLPTDADAAAGSGSIIIVVATDAPLLPHQCAAVAKRASFGLARTGGGGERNSGDFAIAFTTANREPRNPDGPTAGVQAVAGDSINHLYWAAIEATEQAIVNALLAAKTMVGVDGNTAHALPLDAVEAALGSRPEGV